MSNPEGEITPPVVQETEPPKVTAPPVTSPPPARVDPPAPGQDYTHFFKGLSDAVAAIPERIVDAMKEYSPKPTSSSPPANDPPGNAPPSGDALPPGEKPKGRSFAQRWFGN